MTSSTSIFTNGCASPGTSRNAVCLCRPQAPTRYGNTLLFVHTHRGLAAKTARKYIQKLSAFAEYLEAPASPNSAGLRHSTFASSTRMLKNDGPRRSYGSTLRVFFRWAAVQGDRKSV